MNITHPQTLVSGYAGRSRQSSDILKYFHFFSEALEQVTANLANFAYDPINWPHLHEADALDVFIASIENPNPNIQLHAVAGLCNFCLGKNFVICMSV